MWQPGTRVFRPLNKPEFGLMNAVSDTMANLENAHPHCYTDIRDAELILLASDFSGQHRQSTYHSTSFVMTGLGSYARWEASRRSLRAGSLGMRRMSFKSLGDRRRRDALPAFLSAASTLRGAVITVAIHKSLGFDAVELDIADLGIDHHSRWNPGALRKLVFTSHLASIILAGFSAPGQDMWWFLDEDDIVANETRVREATQIAGHITCYYLPHTMGHFRLGNTKCDPGDLWIEDIAAIPDLVGGSVCELLTKQPLPSYPVVSAPPHNLTAKSRLILEWCALSSGCPLRHVVLRLEPSPSGRVQVGYLDFACEWTPSSGA